MRTSPLFRATVLFATLSPAAHALTPEELFEKVSPSVFVIHSVDPQGRRNALGSGVVIGREQVITTCHVLRNASGIVVSRGNVSFGAEVEFPDAERDLCQLRVKELGAPAVPFADVAKLRIGQRAYAIGAPRGLELTLTEGIISSLRGGDDDKQPLIQTSAAVSRGSSGGGLFDADGRLIGITTFQMRDGQQLNFAVSVEWVREVPQRGKEALAKRKEAEEAARAAGLKAGATGVALAPIDPTLPKEMPQAGDTWTYVVRDMRYKPNDRSRKYVHTVRTSAKGSIIEVVTANGAEVGQHSYSTAFSAVYRGGADLVEFAPFAAALQSFKPGEPIPSVRVQGQERHPAIVSGDLPYRLDGGRVIGSEQVTVAAGTFDAMRVELNGRISNAAMGGSAIVRGYARFRQTVWYAPQVKRVVKSVATGPNFTTQYELESYSLR
jgi:Trypsin-like peptidase domain